MVLAIFQQLTGRMIRLRCKHKHLFRDIYVFLIILQGASTLVMGFLQQRGRNFVSGQINCFLTSKNSILKGLSDLRFQLFLYIDKFHLKLTQVSRFDLVSALLRRLFPGRKEDEVSMISQLFQQLYEFQVLLFFLTSLT